MYAIRSYYVQRALAGAQRARQLRADLADLAVELRRQTLGIAQQCRQRLQTVAQLASVEQAIGAAGRAVELLDDVVERQAAQRCRTRSRGPDHELEVLVLRLRECPARVERNNFV